MASYYAEQFAGDNYFGQSGTNIPSFGIQGGYAGGSSTDVPPYFGGYVANAPAPGMGGSPGQPFSQELIDKLSLPITQPPKDFLNNFLKKQQQQPPGNLQAANFMGASGSSIPGASQPNRQPLLPGEQPDLIQNLYGPPIPPQRFIQIGFPQLPPA
jgi:hypothetical protein